MDNIFKRAEAAQEDLNKILVALAPRSSLDRRRELPQVKRQEAYESTVIYLRESGEHYTAALVEECLSRVDRRRKE